MTISFGHVLFSAAEMDAWPSSGSVYTATATSFVGNTAFVFTDFGTAITTSAQMQAFHEQAVRAKGQAALWKADGITARKTKAIEHFNCVKDIATISADQGQDNLELSWAIMNLVPALAMIGRANYSNAQMDAFLENVAYNADMQSTAPLGIGLDWSTGGNWLMTMAAARLAIASYLEDQTLWDDAKAYTEFRIAQCIYHSTYDGGTINPILGSNHTNRLWPGTVGDPPSPSATSDHWWGAVTASPYNATYGAYSFENGVNAEMLRDLAHENMTVTAACQAALIIERANDTVSADMMARVTGAVAWTGRRVLYWLQNGTLETASPAGLLGAPGPIGVSNALNYRYGWFTAKRLLGGAAPSVVASLVAHPSIATPPSYGGQNHQTIERFSEGTIPILAVAARSWGGWTATALAPDVVRQATAAAAWGGWSATGTATKKVVAVAARSWGGETATASATVQAAIGARGAAAWGGWTATTTTRVSHTAAAAKAWGAWTGTVAARRGFTATAAKAWGGWSATATPPDTTPAAFGDFNPAGRIVDDLAINWDDPDNYASGAAASVTAAAAKAWGGWTATVAARVSDTATAAATWGALTAAALARVSVTATAAKAWGAWTGTVHATTSRDVTAAATWGTLTASAAADIDHPATAAKAWGAWSATALAGKDTPTTATALAAWGTWTADLNAGVAHHALVVSGAWGATTASVAAGVTVTVSSSGAWGELAAAATAVVDHPAAINETWAGWQAQGFASVAGIPDPSLAVALGMWGTLIAAVIVPRMHGQPGGIRPHRPRPRNNQTGTLRNYGGNIRYREPDEIGHKR